MALVLDPPAPAHRHLLIVGTATYRDGWPALGDVVRAELAAIRDLFLATLNFSPDTCEEIVDPGGDLLRRVAAWATRVSWGSDDAGVVYYTGHGIVPDGSPLRVITSDIGIDEGHVATRAADLVAAVWGGPLPRCPRLLFIVDTCFAGGGSIDLLGTATALREAAGGAARGAEIQVMASARSIEQARGGLFVSALADAVRGGLVASSDDEWVNLDALVGEVNRLMAERGPASRGAGQRAEVTGRSEKGAQFFPNPHWVPRLRARMPSDQRRRILHRLHAAALRSHWSPRGRGVLVESDPAWRFTGRRRALQHLVSWLADPAAARGQCVMGRPGSGKSALLGRLVLLSEPALRSAADAARAVARAAAGTVPAPGSIATAIHARRKSAADVALELAAGLDLDLVTGGASEDVISAVTRALERLTSPAVVVLDAIEESSAPDQVASMLRDFLEETPSIRLLVGVRRGDPPPGRLIDRLGSSFQTLDLDDEKCLDRADVETHVFEAVTTAPTSPYHDEARRQAAREVARAVAKRAGASFLIASRTAWSIAQASRPLDAAQLDALPATVGDVFERDLDTLPRAGRKRLGAALAALAVAEGRGLPRDLWAPVASAVGGLDLRDTDVEQAASDADFYVAVDEEAGVPVYRLYHEEFARHLRAAHPGADEHAFHALVALIAPSRQGGREWQRAPAYVRLHLAAHAAAAGCLDELIQDPAFLVYAEPSRVVEALGSVGSQAREHARVYELVSHRLEGAAAGERLAYLQMASWQHHGGLLPGFRALALETPFRVRWALWFGSPANRLLYGSEDARDAYVAATADEEGAIVVIRADRLDAYRLDGRLVLTVDHVVGKWPHGVAIAADRWLVTADIVEQRIFVYGFPAGAAVAAWHVGTGVMNWCAGVHDGHLHVACVGRESSESLEVWKVVGHEATMLWSKDVPGFAGLSMATMQGLPALVASHSDGALRVWHLLTARLLAQRPIDHHGPVASMDSPDGTLIVSGEDERIAVYRERDGRLELAHPPQAGHAGGVTALHVGVFEGVPAVASVGRDNQACVWRLSDSTPLFRALIGFRGVHPTSIALTAEDKQSAVVTADSRGAVRVWRGARAPRPNTIEELIAIKQRGARGLGLLKQMRAFAIGNAWRLVTRTADGAVNLYDAVDGIHLPGSEDWLESACLAIAVGSAHDDRPFIAACRNDGALLVWDAATLTRLAACSTGVTGDVHGLAVWPVGAHSFGGILRTSDDLLTFHTDDVSVARFRGSAGLYNPEPTATVAAGEVFVIWGARESLGSRGPVGGAPGEDVVCISRVRGRELIGAVRLGHGASYFQLSAPCVWAGRPIVVEWVPNENSLAVVDLRDGARVGEPKFAEIPSGLSHLACATTGDDLLVAVSTPTGRIHILRWPNPVLTVETDSSPQEMAFIAPGGLAVAATEGLMVIDVRAL
jgi:hypothetical protein